MINNSENFINTNHNFIFIHYPFPHLPIQALSLHLNDIKMNNLVIMKNLFLVDMTILNIQNSISKYKDSLLIITSDHWHRKPYLRTADEKKLFLFYLFQRSSVMINHLVTMCQKIHQV